jgi:V8-like Glu-specific endopeptidase
MRLQVKFNSCVVFAITSLLFLVSTVFASSAMPVKWSELAGHLQRQSVVMEPMPVVDCPAAIDEDSAEHLVCQVIENTFYKWKEYEFFDSEGETCLALEMMKPEARLLTADEAQVLLNASKSFKNQIAESYPNFMTRQPAAEPPKVDNSVYSGPLRTSSDMIYQEMSVDQVNDIQGDNLRSFHQDGMSESDGTVEIRGSVHGSDDRERVTYTTNFPWNTICYLDFMKAGSDYRGSGILISPYFVLTCGHNVWDQDLQVWADNAKVTPAQHQDYQGATIYEPYGTVDVCKCEFHSNACYVENDGGFECDYGGVQLGRRFSGISTFMPIEYDATPTAVNIAGYPGEVQGESSSYDMWLGYDSVTGYEGINNRIMLHTVDTSGGQSGAPVWRYNKETKNRRLVAIHVYGGADANGACRLVSAMESTISEWMQYEPEVGYSNFSYIPYFTTGSSRWTGVALANYNSADNGVKLDYYSADGSHLGRELKSIPAHGQTSFATATAVGTEGWIMVSSTAPLTGLALIGDSEYASMYDIDLKTSLHRKFLCPHLAANSEWRSFALVCNPNDTDARISFTYYDTDGSLVDQITAPPIPAHGSVKHSLYGLFQQELNGGTLVIETVQPVTAFLLYDNKSTTWKAGLSAVPID